MSKDLPDLPDLPGLPDLIDPARAVAHSQHYAGTISANALARLQSLIAEPGEDLVYSLRFGRDDARRSVVHVAVRGRLRLTCQRCLGMMDWLFDEHSVLALVQGFDEAARLPDDYDPLLLEEPLLRPLRLIEDEVLLAVPAITRHLQCDGPDSLPADLPRPMRPEPLSPEPLSPEPLSPERVQESDQDVSPFAVLAEWKANRR